MADGIVIEDVISDLERVQKFDVQELVQISRLGSELQFDEAVEPAKRLVALFSKLPSESVREFPHSELSDIQALAKSAFNLFQQVLDFDVKAAEPDVRRDRLIKQIANAYQSNFTRMYPLISFAMARTVDFNQLSADGRAAVQDVRDEAMKLMDELNSSSEKASNILAEVRDLAAEQGVTQQAKYFGDEASKHDELSTKWLIASAGVALSVLAYAVFTLFLPVLGWFKAESTLDSIQLLASKFLIFVVLSFALLQSVRNYQAHRHNAVANSHRQNALLTYKTLAEAGNSVESRDTVLQHAAAAIYAPSDSGYMRSEERGYGGTPVIGFTPKNTISGTVTADT